MIERDTKTANLENIAKKLDKSDVQLHYMRHTSNNLINEKNFKSFFIHFKDNFKT